MKDPPNASSPENTSVLRPDFHWGFATAAAQVEGAWDADGKGPSIWDKFSRIPGKIIDGRTTADGTRAYDLYKDDVQLLKKLGVNSYRFSLAWSRIIPLGGKDDPVNEAGLKFYSNLVDELLANNITPFVTLYHWDAPQALENRYGGMLNQAHYTADFERYARVCFAALGDRVKHWITYNEPGIVTTLAYAEGVHAPGRSSLPGRNDPGDSSTEPFIVGHTQLVSHAHAVKIYREEFKPSQKGVIGITLHGNYSAPWDENDPKDVEATQRALEFEIGWFADPVYGSGDYPASMREQLGSRLPQFTPAERALVQGSSDFYGMNSYTTFFVRHRDEPADINDYKGNVTVHDTNKAGLSRGLETPTSWLRSNPAGFHALLHWIWSRYHTPIYITENGTTAKGDSDWDPSSGSPLDDAFRQNFFEGYIGAVAAAVKQGVDIRSYFAWTFTDNWEWAAGFTDRFGGSWVDFESAERKRYPKKSAFELGRIFGHLIGEKKDAEESRNKRDEMRAGVKCLLQ
ncbi:glycoside hydrolase [Aureobasidium namibiae CBS 147.97]|uniref:beta-glucosidase n=1 Tax=Aureobasidium namibiae CBS 147.97 TaxID=1043004 RepID=A0A074WWH6_9PEZI